MPQRRRRLERIGSMVLIGLGLALLATPVVQAGVGKLAQAKLRAAFAAQRDVFHAEALQAEAPSRQAGAAGGRITGRDVPSGKARRPAGKAEAGPEENPVLVSAEQRDEQPPAPPRDIQAMGRILIPKIGLDAIVVAGTSTRALALGPGFYDEVSRPDQGGNVAIAGHRTTYGAWFRHVDRLEPGDIIRLEYGGREYEYRVEQVWAVAANDWSVIAPTEEHVLTLTTCHPPGSNRERLVVRARRADTLEPDEGIDPAGSA